MADAIGTNGRHSYSMYNVNTPALEIKNSWASTKEGGGESAHMEDHKLEIEIWKTKRTSTFCTRSVHFQTCVLKNTEHLAQIHNDGETEYLLFPAF